MSSDKIVIQPITSQTIYEIKGQLPTTGPTEEQWVETLSQIQAQLTTLFPDHPEQVRFHLQTMIASIKWS